MSLHLENSDSSTMNLPVPRYFHAAAVHRHKMFVSGGFNGREYLSDMWQFDMLQGRCNAELLITLKEKLIE